MPRRLWLSLLSAVVVIGFLVTPATPAASANDQLPDLAMARLRSFSIENTTDGRRLLRFTTVIVNIGAGGAGHASEHHWPLDRSAGDL